MKKHWLVLLGALAVFGLLLSACGGAAETAAPAAEPTQPAAEATQAPATEEAAGEVQELNIYNWSTYIAPDTIPNFEEQFNVKVNYDLFDSNEELLAKIQPGNPGYDIIVPTDYMVTIMVNQGLLEELNHDNIPNMANIHPTFVDPAYDPGNKHCVPYQWGTMGLGYNIKATGGEIDSWDVMFDEKYAGRLSWLDDPRAVIGIALLYLGYDMNSTNPDEIAAARDLLLDQKHLVAAFAPDTGQILLDEGEVDITMEWSGDIFQVMEENPDLRYVIPKEGSMVWTDNLCIPTGAPHKELAEQFINYILDAQVGADLSNYIRYGTPNKASLPLINEEDRNNPGIYPPEETMARLQFVVDVGEATLLYDEAWTDIKAE